MPLNFCQKKFPLKTSQDGNNPNCKYTFLTHFKSWTGFVDYKNKKYKRERKKIDLQCQKGPTQEEDCKKLKIDLQCQRGPTQEEDCEKFCALVDEKMS